MNESTEKIKHHVRHKMRISQSLRDLHSELSTDDDKNIKKKTYALTHKKENFVKLFMRDFSNVNSRSEFSSPDKNDMNFTLFLFNKSILMLIFFFLTMIYKFKQIYNKYRIESLINTYYKAKNPLHIRDDIIKLKKIPQIVSFILHLDEFEKNDFLKLVNYISDLTFWSSSAGIPQISFYDPYGILFENYQKNVIIIGQEIIQKFSKYYKLDSIPSFSIEIPHVNAILHSDSIIDNNFILHSNKSSVKSFDPNINYLDISTLNTSSSTLENIKNDSPQSIKNKDTNIKISLLSKIDGKQTIIEVTKSMSDLVFKNELSIDDVGINLIDSILIDLIGPEPDLVVCFGPCLNLKEYPPWHIRLSEIFWEIQNNEVNYTTFIKALKKFSNCKVNLGK